MHLLKKRQKLILEYLLQKEFPVTVKHIADQLHVSKRTVRYDLDALDYWMKCRELVLKRVPKKGIWIEDKRSVQKVLDEETTIEDVKAYRILSRDERKRELLAILFSADERIAVSELANAIGVSKSTCYSDLENVKHWLEKRNLTLDNKAHSGYRIEASEEDWRMGLIEFLEMTTDNQQLMNLVTIARKGNQQDQRLEIFRRPEYHDLFSDVDLERMVMFVQGLEEKLDIHLMDSAYAALMIHTAIAIKRLREGEVIGMDGDQLAELRIFDAFNVVEEVFKSMNFINDVPEAEVAYITAHIISARMRERKISYKKTAESIKTVRMDKDKQDMLNTILEIVTQHCTIQRPDALKKELKDYLLSEFEGNRD